MVPMQLLNRDQKGRTWEVLSVKTQLALFPYSFGVGLFRMTCSPRVKSGNYRGQWEMTVHSNPHLFSCASSETCLLSYKKLLLCS